MRILGLEEFRFEDGEIVDLDQCLGRWGLRIYLVKGKVLWSCKIGDLYAYIQGLE